MCFDIRRTFKAPLSQSSSIKGEKLKVKRLKRKGPGALSDLQKTRLVASLKNEGCPGTGRSTDPSAAASRQSSSDPSDFPQGKPGEVIQTAPFTPHVSLPGTEKIDLSQPVIEAILRGAEFA